MMARQYLLKHLCGEDDRCNMTSMTGWRGKDTAAYVVDNWKKFYSLYAKDCQSGIKHYLQTVLSAETIFMMHVDIDKFDTLTPIVREFTDCVLLMFDVDEHNVKIIVDVNKYNPKKCHLYATGIYVNKITAKECAKRYSDTLREIGIKADVDCNFAGLRLPGSYKYDKEKKKTVMSVYMPDEGISEESLWERHLLSDDKVLSPLHVGIQRSISASKSVEVNEVRDYYGNDHFEEIDRLARQWDASLGKVNKIQLTEIGGNDHTVISYHRKKSSHCDLCNKRHDRDGCLYIRVIMHPGSLEIFGCCYKARGRKVELGSISTQSILSHDNDDEQDGTVTTYTIRETKRVEETTCEYTIKEVKPKPVKQACQPLLTIIYIEPEREELAKFYKMSLTAFVDDETFKVYSRPDIKLVYKNISKKTYKTTLLKGILKSMGWRRLDGNKTLSLPEIKENLKEKPLSRRANLIARNLGISRIPKRVTGILDMISTQTWRYMMIRIEMQEDKTYKLHIGYKEFFPTIKV